MKLAKINAVSWLLAAALLAASVTCLADEPVRAERHMAVTANPHASDAALGVLRAGGGAVDAAIAAQLVLSLVEPQSSGIGGGAFMLHFAAPEAADEPGVITAYDGRETAPAAATPDMFLDEHGRPASFFAVGVGGLSVGVPSVMRMLEMAHAEHGRLPWEALFEPAIELAEQGFEVSPRLHMLLDRFGNLARVQSFRDYFYDADGEPHPVGYRLINPEYAETLRTLAAEGADAMYTGALAEAIVREVRDSEVTAGRMTLEDLRAYRPRKSEPLCSAYREWRVCGPRLPSSGGVTVQQILGMLEPFDVPALKDDPVRGIHLIAEASRLAFADRNFYLADPDFVDVPLAGLMSEAYLRQRAGLIDLERAMPSVAPGTPPQSHAGLFAASAHQDRPSTSHLSIVDAWGHAVTMTTTVQGAFGSQLMVGGFILNNQLTDFSFEPERDGRPVANRAEAGKRPLSSMSPTLVTDGDGRLRLVIGSPGGTRIIGYVLRTLVGVLDWEQDVQEAVAAPHFLAQTGPLEVEEDTLVAALQDALAALGHEVAVRNLNSGLHGIAVEHATSGRALWGGADPRREGVAVGD